MPAGIINRRASRERRSERVKPGKRPAPIQVVSATKSAAVMTIVFNQPVALKGVPEYTTNLAGITATAASLTNPTTLSLTFSATVATATSLLVPFEDAAVRNASGGYANAGTFPVS